VFDGIKESQAVEFSTAENSETQKRVTAKAAVYHRLLSGLESGSFTVRVNGAGKVYRVTRNMRDVTALRPYPVLSTAEALQAIEAGNCVITGPAGPNGPYHATIDRVQMIYYEGSPGTDMDTVQPVYVISGTVEGFRDRFKAMLPAVRPQYLTPPTLATP
jgi:redox-regulated HSP33 family molecular chaperone